MGLKPLEFADCLLDSPYFRENIHEHERELERTNEAIKHLIKECKSLLKATENLSKAQRSFANVLNTFRFECIGEVETDDEILIADALKEFSKVINQVEDERDRMLDYANARLIVPLEIFRKEQIGGAKEEKKKFDKQTEKYCTSVQNNLNLSSKKKETLLHEADAQLQMERRVFHQTALDYVFKLQEVNEKKKFEFVETLLSFMYGQMTFYHSGHEACEDYKVSMTELQLILQNTRERFDATKEQAESLMNKTQQKAQSGELQHIGAHTRQGYLFVQERKRGGIGTTWNKHYCMYTRENKILTMVPYVQTQGKSTACTDTMVVSSCTRRMTDSIDKRFCFDITAQERVGTIVLQALNEEDRRLWLEAMDGKEPDYVDHTAIPRQEEREAKDMGIAFIKKCIKAVEKRGITDQGLYRVVGVGSKVQNLVFQCIENKKVHDINLVDSSSEWEVKTITSGLKQYLRNMSTPVFTFDYHEDFLTAVKHETYDRRIEHLKKLTAQLPEENRVLIKVMMRHLKRVAAHSKQNLMAASNLGVVFGPTLLRSKEETVAAIMSLKYQSIVVELMVNEYEQIFGCDDEAEEEEENVKPSPPPKKKNNSSSDEAVVKVNSVTYNSSEKPALPGPKPPSSKSYPAPPPPSRVQPVSRPRSVKPVNNAGSDSDDDSIKSESSASNSSTGSAALNDIRSLNDLRSLAEPNPAPVARNPSPVGPRKDRGEKPAPPKRTTSESIALMRSRFENAAVSNSTSPTSSQAPRPLVMEKRNSLPRKKVATSDAGGTTGNTRCFSSAGGVQKPRNSPPPVPITPPPEETPLTGPPRTPRKVRTLYPCIAENSSELSFDANVVITNVRDSREPGWLEGTYNGKTGLVPSNYVEPYT